MLQVSNQMKRAQVGDLVRETYPRNMPIWRRPHQAIDTWIFAAWVVDATRKPPHGAAFKRWAVRAKKRYPGDSPDPSHTNNPWPSIDCMVGIQGAKF